ncbi:MAG: NPCBM/NEW2 domain-containing protein [Planctomycetota bacterium]
MSYVGRGLGAALTYAVVVAQGPIVATRIDGTTIAAADLASEDGRAVQFSGDGPDSHRIGIDELDSIAFRDAVGFEPRPSKGRVWLRSGPSCEATLEGGDGEAARLDLPFAKDAAITWRALRALTLAPLQPDDEAAFQAALDAPQTTADALFARDRNSGATTRLSVVVLGIRDRDLMVDFRGERPVPLDQVLAIVFGTENGAAPPSLPLPTVQVDLLRGKPKVSGKETWRGRLLRIDSSVARVELAEGPILALPMPSIVKLTVNSSKVLWLDSIEPTRVDRTAAFDVAPTWMRNATAFGSALHLAESVYGRGLCLRPRTRLEFQVPAGDFDRLEALVGIDERSEGPADAIVRVSRGDQTVFEATHIDRDVVRKLRVPVKSGETIAIEVDFGDNFDLGDHVVIANARFLRG